MKILDVLVEILKELKLIRRQLEEMTGKYFTAGKRFDF